MRMFLGYKERIFKMIKPTKRKVKKVAKKSTKKVVKKKASRIKCNPTNFKKELNELRRETVKLYHGKNLALYGILVKLHGDDVDLYQVINYDYGHKESFDESEVISIEDNNIYLKSGTSSTKRLFR